MSEGVTTPKQAVLLAKDSGWTKTAGFFIEQLYHWNAKDWHGSIAGKSRSVIMQELISDMFRAPAIGPLPAKTGVFKPDVYHQYVTESIDLFVPKDLSNLLQRERKGTNGGGVCEDNDSKMEIDDWRAIYHTIPQLNKPGADGQNPMNSIGVVLTEDLIVGYFDEINGQDILYIILIWSKVDDMYKEHGWCLPGKRDRAYDPNKGDLSIEDANCSLVEKEIGVKRHNIIHHTVLGYFDDRKREQRMKSSGFVSFVLLDSKPQLQSSKMIAVPLNGLLLLARREIQLSRHPQENDTYRLTRNHDSLLMSVFDTTKFYHTMQNFKVAQARYKAEIRAGRAGAKWVILEIDAGFECTICADLMVEGRVICKNGHTVCRPCVSQLDKRSGCPFCRSPIFNDLISNLALNAVIQAHYPKKYAERCQQMIGTQPTTWETDAMFNGTVIFYA